MLFSISIVNGKQHVYVDYQHNQSHAVILQATQTREEKSARYFAASQYKSQYTTVAVKNNGTSSRATECPEFSWSRCGGYSAGSSADAANTQDASTPAARAVTTGAKVRQFDTHFMVKNIAKRCREHPP